MTAPVLSFRHVFGVKSDVCGPLHYIDDTTVLYAAGHQIVLHNTQTRQQRTIPATYDRSSTAHTASSSSPAAPPHSSSHPPCALFWLRVPCSDMNGPQGATDICTLAVSPNKRSVVDWYRARQAVQGIVLPLTEHTARRCVVFSYVAVCERCVGSVSYPIVTVVDLRTLKKRRTFGPPSFQHAAAAWRRPPLPLHTGTRILQ